MIKHNDQKQLGEERFYSIYTTLIQFIIEGNWGSHSKQGRNFKARGQGRVLITGSLLNGFLNLPSGLAPPTVGCAPHQSLIKENGPQAYLQSNLTEAFFNSGLLLSAGFSSV